MSAAEKIVLHTGQAVPWPHAPGGIAQIEDLMRRNVRIIYKASTGRVRRPKIAAAKLANLIEKDCNAGPSSHTPVLPIFNMLGRGVRMKIKAFKKSGANRG